VQSAMSGELDDVKLEKEPFFGLSVPSEVPGLAQEVLLPKNTWADPNAYVRQAHQLAESFAKHFEPFSDLVSAKVIAAGP